MAKRNPSNTVSEQAKAFSDVQRKLSAPSGLSSAALPFWESIVGTRAPGEWQPADIAIAAHLAEDQALLVTLRSRLDKDGWTTHNGKVSGAASLLDTVHRRVLSTSRLLQLHPRGRTGLQSRDLNARRRAAHKAAGTLEELDGDPLIKTH